MKLLKNIDDYFYAHTKKEFMYSILGSVLLIGFIYFYFIYPNAENFEKVVEKKYNNLLQTLQQTRIKLNVFKTQKVRLSNDLKISKIKLINLKKQKSFYQELVNLLDFARFNDTKWANYVKNIIYDAKKEDLNIKVIENKIFDEDANNTKFKNLPKSLIVKEMSIGIELNGNYKNFIHYLYKYENLKDLLRVETIKIKSTNLYYVKFILYGYEK